MHTRLPPVQLFVFIALFPLIAQAQMYRWVDESGKVHYSDRAPASKPKDLQVRPLRSGAAPTPALPYGLQLASKNFPVTLYTAKDCGDPCVQARALLDKRGVPYSEVSIRDDAGVKQLKALSGDASVPVMTVGRDVQKGFEPGAYQSALDAAGYPTLSVLPPGVTARQAEPEPTAPPAEKTKEELAPAPASAPAPATPAEGAAQQR